MQNAILQQGLLLEKGKHLDGAVLFQVLGLDVDLFLNISLTQVSVSDEEDIVLTVKDGTQILRVSAETYKVALSLFSVFSSPVSFLFLVLLFFCFFLFSLSLFNKGVYFILFGSAFLHQPRKLMLK